MQLTHVGFQSLHGQASEHQIFIEPAFPAPFPQPTRLGTKELIQPSDCCTLNTRRRITKPTVPGSWVEWRSRQYFRHACEDRLSLRNSRLMGRLQHPMLEVVDSAFEPQPEHRGRVGSSHKNAAQAPLWQICISSADQLSRLFMEIYVSSKWGRGHGGAKTTCESP